MTIMLTKAKVIILSLICVALTIALCSCTQSQVNHARIPGGENAEAIDPAITDNDAHQDIKEAYAFGKYVEDEHAFIEDPPFDVGFDLRINYYVNEIKLVDSLEDAGIDKEAYQLSDSRTYDHYITVSMTIENVAVPVDDEDFDNSFLFYINSFRLRRQMRDGKIDYSADYFDRGGVASSDPKSYFQYQLPSIGEKLDVMIAFGLSDEEISAIKANNEPLFLHHSDMIGMMPIEGV